MHPTRIILCTLIFLCQGVPHVMAQYKLEQPVVIRKEQGLPSNDIRSIRKSNDGFIWLATAEGLCRFDGHQFKIYQEAKDPVYSLYENSVLSVLPVEHKIWAGTHQGISILNTIDHSFKHYQLTDGGKINAPPSRRHDQQVTVLQKDKSGIIWIGTRSRGVYSYDADKDDFIHYTFSREEFPALVPTLGSDYSVLSIEESKRSDSIIWAGTAGGLQEINKYTGRVKLISFPQKSKDYQVALNAFRRLYHHDNGLLYVSSWAAGVNVYDPAAGTFTPLPVKSKEGKDILNSTIGNIFRKSTHEIWISTGSGLAVYDTEQKDIVWTKFNNPAQKELYSILYIDDAKRIWCADFNGLQYFDPVMQQFTRHSFKHLSNVDWGYAFYIFSDITGDHITVCPRLTDGIYHFDRKKNTWKKSPFSGNHNFKTERDVLRGFAQLPSGDYIISADKGVFIYSMKQQRLIPVQNGLPVSPTRRGEILLDRSGNLWLSDDSRGLVKWKPGAQTHKVYNNGLFSVDSNRFFNRLVNLYEDSRGNIWFERIGGYGVYVASRDSVISFLFEKDPRNGFPNAHAFAEDKKGRVWITGGGALGYSLSSDPAKGAIYKRYLKEQSISGYVYHLATDPHGEVWGYNSSELIKINAEDLSFTRYSFQYGVKEADFYHFSFLPGGEMIFGGRNDITIANPAELKRNTELPVPYIVEMQVMNQPVMIRGDDPLQHLSYHRNSFSVMFSARAYSMVKDIRFRYRLRDFDDDWTEAGTRRFANYTNLPGGDYVFQLQAANNEGVWNEKILEMPVHVSTPWWLTWWFRIGFILLVAGLTWWFYRFRINQIKKKEKLKSQYEKKLANVEMTALLAQMNPHFLFNSLNSIDSYIIKNESKKASEYLNNFARLMRLILQNSRSNYISLKDELETLELYMQMERLRFKDKFEYEILVDKQVDTSAIVIPPMLIQPYVENAIWHGLMHKNDGVAGKVEVIVGKQDDSLFCVVQDNGIGREKAEELKAQKSANHKRSMGMQITMDRVEMINKLYSTNTTIKITDLKDQAGNAKGTRVELVIPV